MGKASPIPKVDKSKLGLSISTRLDMLPRIVDRLNNNVMKVFEAAKKHKIENISTKHKEGFVLDIDEDLKFNLLIDIDSLLIKLNSVCELMSNLFLCQCR